jgi:hypothetical protein
LPPHGYHLIFSIGECFGDCDEAAEAEAEADADAETEVETETTEK